MTAVRRFAAALVAAFAAVVAGAPAASAHTIGGVQATNYRSEITAITPTTPGVTVRLRDLGRRIELVNRSREDVVVQGYQDEPYLRVGPAGVFENRRSPSLYQNQITTGNASLVVLPPEADATAPPEWRRRGGGDTVSWRDHRARWEGADPPTVRANPGVAQTVVARWSVGLLKGPSQSSIVVTGRIAWVPSPAAWPWLLVTAVFFAAAFVAGAMKRWWTALSGLLAFVLAVDMVRLYGAATQGGGALVAGLVKALLFGLLEVMAWAAGVWAIGAIQQRRPVGLFAAMAVGLAIGLVSGVGDLLNLTYSQLPTSLPAFIARASVAACLGLGFGLVGGSFLVLRKFGPLVPAARV